MAMDDKPFQELLATYFDGEATDQEIEQLHEAVFEQGRRDEFREAMRLNVLMRETLAEQAEVSSLAETFLASEPKQTHKSSFKQIALAVLATAAVVFALVWRPQSSTNPVAGHGFFWDVSGAAELQLERAGHSTHARKGDSISVGDVVHCGADTRAMIRLEDGSILSMEPNSSLTLVSQRPQVRLDRGKVLFEIESRSDDEKPFEVRTGQSTVEVMGTMFTLEADEHTHLKVYEGRVMFKRHIDNVEVEVGSQQMASTENRDLGIESLGQPKVESTSILTLLPTDDVTWDHGGVNNGSHLKVQRKNRTVYLRFEIPAVDGIRGARLRLTQDIDPGSGTLKFFEAESSDWSETEVSGNNLPKRGRMIAQRSGVVRPGQVVDVDVTDAVVSDSPVSFVVTLDRDREQDIWFGSRESQSPPQLLLTVERPARQSDAIAKQ